MLNILLEWLVLSGAVYLAASILPGFQVRGFRGALIVAAIFGLLNWLLGAIFFHVIGIATLGLGYLLAFLTRWLVTAVLLKVTDAISGSLTIRSFGTAFLGGLIISAVGTLAQMLLQRL